VQLKSRLGSNGARLAADPLLNLGVPFEELSFPAEHTRPLLKWGMRPTFLCLCGSRHCSRDVLSAGPAEYSKRRAGSYLR
jgi:hypothetical protein